MNLLTWDPTIQEHIPYDYHLFKHLAYLSGLDPTIRPIINFRARIREALEEDFFG